MLTAQVVVVALIVDWDGLPGYCDVYCFMDDVVYVRHVEVCM
jgi:hypothetical protein